MKIEKPVVGVAAETSPDTVAGQTSDGEHRSEIPDTTAQETCTSCASSSK